MRSGWKLDEKKRINKMLHVEAIFTHLLIVVAGSLIGSLIFTSVFIIILKHTILTSAHKLISQETKRKVAEWLEEVVRNGISDALKDERVKKIVEEILELVKDKLK